MSKKLTAVQNWKKAKENSILTENGEYQIGT